MTASMAAFGGVGVDSSFIRANLGSAILAKESAVNDYVDISTAGAETYLVAQFISTGIRRECGGANRSDTTPTATLLSTGFSLLELGDLLSVRLLNVSAAARTLTVLGGTSITLPVAITLAQGEQCRLLFVRTSAAGAAATFDCFKLPVGAFDTGGPLVVSGDVDAVNGTFSGDVASDNLSVTTDLDTATLTTTGLATLASVLIGSNVLFTPTPVADATAGNSTYAAAGVLTGLINRDGGATPRTDVLPDGDDLTAAAGSRTAFLFALRNTGTETVTLSGGTGSTIQGTATTATATTSLFFALSVAADTWVFIRLS